MSKLLRSISSRLLPSRTTMIVVGTGIVVGGMEYTTHIPSTKLRSTTLYHTIADQIITPSLRYFLDPEDAHHIAIYMSQYGLAPIYHPSSTEQRCIVSSTIEFHTKQQQDQEPDTSNNTIQIRPLHVSNVIGLAAGFDKDAIIIQPMLQLGFGYVEVGTVTVQPQPGNPKPRLFRLTQDDAIINRYGFNSTGAIAVKENLIAYRKKQQEQQQMLSGSVQSDQNLFQRTLHWIFSTPAIPTGPVGVNLGVNKTSVEIQDVLNDYTSLIQNLGPYADYLVINISSPNTPGLRDWQTNVEQLQVLLRSCIETRNMLAGDDRSLAVPPLFVKLAPDLQTDQLITIAQICQTIGIDGFVIANTTNQRPVDLIHHHLATLETGGLSGRPVRDISTSMIRTLYSTTQGRIPIIGVGGISSGHDVYEKLRAGASLVQVYSHMVYAGPGLVSKIRHELAELLILHGHRNVNDVIGLDHEEIAWQKRHDRLELQEKNEKQLYVVDSIEDSTNEGTDSAPIP